MDTDDFLQHRKLNLCVILRKPLLCVLHTLGSMATVLKSSLFLRSLFFKFYNLEYLSYWGYPAECDGT